MVHGLVYAQDLEDDYLKISKTEDATLEEDYSDEEEALDDILSNYRISETRVSDTRRDNVDLVAAKKEQLSIVIRRAYYQKLTTPRWVSILAADSWKDSFLKWRYYAQLRNYIANIDSDLTYFKMNKPIAVLAREEKIRTTPKEEITPQEEQSPKAEEEVIVAENTPVEEQDADPGEKVDEIIAALTSDIKEELAGTESTEDEPIAVSQSLASEEAWENNSEEETIDAAVPEEQEKIVVPEEVEEELSFSLAELTLPDDIESERQVYDLAQREQAIEDSLSNIALDEALASAEIAAELQREERRKEEEDREKKAKAKKAQEKAAADKKKRAALALAKKKEDAQRSTTNNTSVVAASKPPAQTTVSTTPRTTTVNRTYAPSTAGVGNRTITAASVAPSTAPRTISAGRQAQTAGFVKRKGKMSWPVMSGTVTDQYGIRANAAARGLKPRNNGVDMSCPTGTSILSVHSGTVMMVAKQAPYDHIVTIKHGDYTSAYYYINRPSVKVGDVVAMGQRLGRLIDGEGEARFHFELWEGQNKVNPEIWLAPR